MSRVVQQINLFQPVFRKRDSNLSSGMLQRILGIFLLALVLFHGYGLWQQSRLMDRHERLTQLREVLEAQLAQLNTTVGNRKPSQVLDLQLQQTSRELDAELRIWNLLEGLIARDRASMSEYFAGLARHTLQGLWLTGIQIRQGGEFLGLSGKVASPELVPQLLERLGEETAFAGRSFRVLNLDRADQQRQLDFYLLTAEPGGDEKVE